MWKSCERANALGLPSIAFTEHIDLTAWSIPAEGIAQMPAEFQTMVGSDGLFHPPPFDVDGYAESIERCRRAFPDLRIRSGVELGEMHWHRPAAAELLASYPFDEVIGSVHSLAWEGSFLVVDRTYGRWDAAEVVRGYLAEVLRLVRSGSDFAVLGHVDYPLRAWPSDAGPVDSRMFEPEYRAVLEELAGSERALELNTRLPASADLLRWWCEAGGRTLTFGSDAHDPDGVAYDFAAAADVARAAGFRPSDGATRWYRR